MKKSIIICSSSYHEYDRRLRRISTSLIENNHKITWISRSYDKNSNVNSEVSHNIISMFFKSGILFYIEFNVRLFFILLSIKSDIITSVDLDTLPACALATIFTKRKLAFDAHEIFYEVPELQGKFFKKWVWKTVARFFVRKSDLNYTVNNSLKLHYENAYKKPFHVIMNVPRNSPEHEVIKDRQKLKTLIYLGVINKGRGIDIAIQSLTALTDYKLIVIGEGDESEAMRSLVIEQGVEDRVEFTSYIKPEALDHRLREGSIGINVLVAESENYRLSLANKFFDYMHAHLPSINMAYPEYTHIIDKHPVGLMIDNYKVKDFVSAVRRLDDTSIYKQLQSNCAKYKHNYNWEIEEQKLKNLYSSL